jgi:hypothetical protein
MSLGRRGGESGTASFEMRVPSQHQGRHVAVEHHGAGSGCVQQNTGNRSFR